ncbi:MAG: protein arginine kinase [Peptococcaceae bacterium]|jgi:protein arginine kinase|nr:protein arginine kinase [Peptococcaceae bacterium]
MSVHDIVDNLQGGWIGGGGPESDVVVSSRVRVARNLAGMPFPHLLNKEGADQVVGLVRKASEDERFLARAGRIELVTMGELSAEERQVLVEKHLVSPDLLNQFEHKAVAIDGEEKISIMINEEDHLRIQVLLPGLQLNEAWQLVNGVDDALELNLDYCFSEQLGYLTACPTNVGTGLRASVMLHLPGLVMANQVRGLLATVTKLGLAVRGLYGEGTEAVGNLFQVSNQVTLGRTEEEVINNLLLITRQLLEHERGARAGIYRERRELVEDKVFRAYGLLKHARILSAGEAMRLFSDLRLGVEMNLLTGIPPELINELMIASRPAYLVKTGDGRKNNYEMDVHRAELIRSRI